MEKNYTKKLGFCYSSKSNVNITVNIEMAEEILNKILKNDASEAHYKYAQSRCNDTEWYECARILDYYISKLQETIDEAKAYTEGEVSGDA